MSDGGKENTVIIAVSQEFSELVKAYLKTNNASDDQLIKSSISFAMQLYSSSQDRFESLLNPIKKNFSREDSYFQMSADLDEKLYHMINTIATNYHLSISDLVRVSVRYYIDELESEDIYGAEEQWRQNEKERRAEVLVRLREAEDALRRSQGRIGESISDDDILISVLERTTKLGVSLACKDQNLETYSVLEETEENYRSGFNGDRKLKSEINDVLGAHSIIGPLFENAGIYAGTFYGVDVENAAMWLVGQIDRGISPSSAVNSLKDFIKSKNRCTIQFAVVLTGVQIDSSFNIGDRVRIDKISSFLPVWQKFELMAYEQYSPKYSEWVVISTEYSKSPAIQHYEGDHIGKTGKEYYGRKKLLDDVEMVIGAYPGAKPVRITEFIVLKDMPISRVDRGWGMHSIKIERGGRTLEPKYLNYLWAGFDCKPEKRKRHFRVILDRLNRADRRDNTIEKAIDLGIALESMLTSDRSHSDPIALPLRLRAAWLMGKTYDERKKLHDLMNILYSMRSQAVHNGEIGKTGKLAPEELLRDGMEHAWKMARYLLSMRSEPDFDKIILGEGV